jgi:endonuclease G
MFYLPPIDPVMKLIASLLWLALALPAQQPPFGSPACSGEDLEPADRAVFFLCHSPARKTPLWVGYTLSAAQLGGSAARPSHFRQDRDLATPGAADADYRHSGFSRGHLAPAADFAWSEQSIRTTFLLSNAVPQKQTVNAGVWASVETRVRQIARRADRVHVFTGTLFEGRQQVIGAGRVAVPSHMYKVVLAVAGERMSMYAWIVPNEDRIAGGAEDFQVSVDEVELRSGLDYFGELDDAREQVLESGRAQGFGSDADQVSFWDINPYYSASPLIRAYTAHRGMSTRRSG